MSSFRGRKSQGLEMWEKGSLTQVNHPCNIFFNPDIKSKRKSYSQSNKTFSEF